MIQDCDEPTVCFCCRFFSAKDCDVSFHESRMNVFLRDHPKYIPSLENFKSLS